MKFTFYGHSCFAIEVAGKKLLFDPFVTGNPLAKDKIDINSIEADYILVSHGHGDHTGDLVAIAKNTKATVITAYEIVNWLNAQGIDHAHPMNFGAFNFEFGEVRFTPATHSSALPDGSYGGNPGGFLIKTSEGNIYYTGDTCLTMDLQLIPRYAKLDFAIMPIGGNFTMNVSDAIMAAEMVQAKKVIGVHFDSFGYIKIDHDKAKADFKAAGLELVLPEIGASFEI
ncbi:MAG: metal-dependent hydrolase [Bacteroidetes bacterium]|nr:metal-dependent hydrolase [Bacteroidota bacterium]